MTSRERRLLDKDKEIRKLKGTAGHYFTCTISAAIENEKLKQELADTKKKLEYAGMILKNLLPHLNGYERLDVQKAIEQINKKEERNE